MMLDPTYNIPPMDPLFIPCKDTPLTEQEVTYYLREAWKEIYGEYPSLDSLAILWGQVALECGRGKYSRCYNFGNVKRRKGETYTSYECGEYINGKYYQFWPYHPQTFFMAHKSALEGAKFHLKFLAGRKRYKKAWKEVINGDPIKYVYELKRGGYFTAPLDKYTQVVVNLTNEFKRRADELMSWQPPKPESEPKEDYELIPEIKEPAHEVTDLIPDTKDPNKNPDEEKINTIVKIFMTIWAFIIGLFASKKP